MQPPTKCLGRVHLPREETRVELSEAGAAAQEVDLIVEEHEDEGADPSANTTTTLIYNQASALATT